MTEFHRLAIEFLRHEIDSEVKVVLSNGGSMEERDYDMWVGSATSILQLVNEEASGVMLGHYCLAPACVRVVFFAYLLHALTSEEFNAQFIYEYRPLFLDRDAQGWDQDMLSPRQQILLSIALTLLGSKMEDYPDNGSEIIDNLAVLLARAGQK